jgi:hypothetical protein
MSRGLAAALFKLLAKGDEASASVFSSEQRRALDEFARRTNFVAQAPKGRGSVYQVVDRSALEAHLRTMRPDVPENLPEGLPQRAANVATHRDSKALKPAHDMHYLLLKAVGAGVSWRNGAGEVFDLSAVTQVAGVGALAMRATDDWYSDRPLWLVENQALFDRTDWLAPNAQVSLMYYAGHIPDRVLEWLSVKSRAPEVVLFPDYDGTGLQNYARLLERCSAPCSFWLMPQWELLLARYGSDAVWRDTQHQFVAAVDRLKALDAPREVLKLCAAMNRQGRALEHEAVWLSRGATERGDM